jgi:SWI/SNF-related matrix-associated actin-dependent regulator 1 of chromatin subfamily A
MIPVPAGLEYLPYQVEGIEFARSRKSVLFGDEMGLGKTVEAIGVINCTPGINSVLVVCPATLRLNWRRELDKWLVREVESVVINYDQLHKLDRSRSYDICILDECTYIKNKSSKRSRLCRGIRARRKLALSGTPILNRPAELWHILHWLAPDKWPLSSWMKFTLRFCGAYRRWIGRKQIWDVSGATHLDELRELLAPLMIRRLKRDVLKELPEKFHQLIELPIDGMTGELKRKIAEVNRVVSAMDTQYAQDVAKLEGALSVVWEEMAQLRHQVGLEKVPMAVELIRDALESGEKVVVFAHHRDVIASLKAALNDFGPVVVHGSVSPENRQLAVDLFQHDSHVRVFIGQIQAAGVGITLTAASHVVFVESDWTPGVMSQAEDRCHRIGQKDSVLVQTLVLENSLDARMAKTLLKKQRIIELVLDVAPKEEKGEEEMIEEKLERIAVALEKIAGWEVLVQKIPPTSEQFAAQKAPVCCPETAAASCTQSCGVAPGESAPACCPKTAAVKADDGREEVKAALRAKGIKFKDAARTETLQKLLADAVVAVIPDPAPADPVTAETDDILGEDPKKPATKDDVRAALIALSAAKGKDEALGLLKAIGKVDKLSDVDPIYYGALLDACKVRGVA